MKEQGQSLNWGGNTVRAAREIIEHSRAGRTIIHHYGLFYTRQSKHTSAISNVCVREGIVLVVHIEGAIPDMILPNVEFVRN